MAIEQYTESLTLKEMNCVIGKNPFGCVHPQGDVSGIDKIEKILKQAGGKPKECELWDYSQGGKGKAKPEYIITFNDDIHTIIVVECKSSGQKHCSEKLNKPSAFAVDGVLYYAKFLKNEYHVVAIAVSGTTTQNMKVDTFYWMRGQNKYTVLEKAKDIILEPQNYMELIKGNKWRKAYSLDEIRNIAIDMHNSLREIKVTEAHKPIFIAGILIAFFVPHFTVNSLVLINSTSARIPLLKPNLNPLRVERNGIMSDSMSKLPSSSNIPSTLPLYINMASCPCLIIRRLPFFISSLFHFQKMTSSLFSCHSTTLEN